MGRYLHARALARLLAPLPTITLTDWPICAIGERDRTDLCSLVDAGTCLSIGDFLGELCHVYISDRGRVLIKYLQEGYPYFVTLI